VADVQGTTRQFRVSREGPALRVDQQITSADRHEADVVWVYDMMSELDVLQHHMAACSLTALGDILFVNTSNGADESHVSVPSPDAPSFLAMDKHTGEVYWSDASPGSNILDGQWSSPAVATLGGVPQVIFAGGDGWLYSFRAEKGHAGKPELLWKFDANPKQSKWNIGGRGDRSNIIGTPVVYDGLVYVAVGDDPEHGEGKGRLWCIDPTRRGDVSAELAVQMDGDQRIPLAHSRIQAVDPQKGQEAVDNPNSAVVWQFSEFDRDGDGQIAFDETMHRTCGTAAIRDDLLFIADIGGVFHCLDAKTGKVHWASDLLSAAWGSPLIVGGHVYIGDEDGDLAIFRQSANPQVAMKEVGGEWLPINADEQGYAANMGNSVYTTPVVANGVLYIANRSHLFAIAPDRAAANAAGPEATPR
jgi:outer membrane protein assembly factor BamB